MLNRKEAERLSEVAMELNWARELVAGLTGGLLCAGCFGEEALVKNIDHWLALWIEHDALIRKAE